MKSAILGIDTSNYRTSVALVSLNGNVLLNRRMLLPVREGERGLRQSDAVYIHLKQLKPLFEELRPLTAEWQISAVCASVSPRERIDSYMPVFETGDTVGRGVAAAIGIPFFQTDHQHGHIRAAQFGTKLEKSSDFIALHLSGGTTDLLSISRDGLKELGSSLDLHAGQLIDRVGVALGFTFPAGPQMENLAVHGTSQGRLGCAMENDDLSCHLSGGEAQALRWINQKKEKPEDISREVFDLLARTVSRMLNAGMKKTGQHDALICGGVASSELFRTMLQERLYRLRSELSIVYGTPELSGDNAVGVALIGMDKYKLHEETGYNNKKV